METSTASDVHGCSRRGCWPSMKMTLGLALRCGIVTLQRLLDVIFICTFDRTSDEWMVLGLTLVLTTLLMALTMKKHWSARSNHRPYGALIGGATALVQIAPLWEMCDKVLFYELPRNRRPSLYDPLLSPDTSTTPRTTSAASPTLGWVPPQSNPRKGSPGENVMRGIRKLSMVNLPQAMASLWCHIYMLMPVYPPTDRDSVSLHPKRAWHLAIAFGAALLSLAFGVADFVLYVWVDDAFVRSNKKLVTLHYLFEIVSRVPTIVLFHVTYSRFNDYWPTWLLLFLDAFVTSSLLLLTRYQKTQHHCKLMSCTRQSLTQLVYSFVMSAPLFFVNIVFFDPGMSFFYLNQVFYAVKYVELLVMWTLVGQLRQHFIVTYGILIGLPYEAYYSFGWAILILTFCNATIVFLVVPYKRGATVADFISGPVLDQSADLDTVGLIISATSGVSADLASQEADRLRSLEHIGEIFEMLWMVSKASQPKNRQRILYATVKELWIQALSWEGTYSDGVSGEVHISINSSPASESYLVIRHSDSAGYCRGNLSANSVTIQGSPRCGMFDGVRIFWDDGSVWTKLGDVTNSGVFGLILPQVALALRWDSQVPQHVVTTPNTEERASNGISLHTDVSVTNEFVEPSASYGRPLLDFLIRYAVITRQSDVISDLYWALVCLSHEDAFPLDEKALACYREARFLLLRSLHCDLGIDWPSQMREGLEEFLLASRHLVRSQREIWQQHNDLFQHHSGRTSGGGAWTLRTQVLRRALKNWKEHRLAKTTRSDASEPDNEFLSWPPQFSRSAAQMSVDLVSPAESKFSASLPIDPVTQFRGVVIEESEVIASKQGPLMLTCRTKRRRKNTWGRDVEEEPEAEGRERYLVKFGDDLRQDQLLLQLMALIGRVWEENLISEDSKFLQLANFKVMAITPQAGYVKCVPEAVPLSAALHQSQGLLDVWLSKNCPADMTLEEVLDNFYGSVAASCVVTYVLGIGDRHLENICITPRGVFFHIDFSFVLGDDPKPFAPAVRLPQQVAQALRRTRRLSKCFRLAGDAYLSLRPFAGLIGSLLRLTAEVGGAGCQKLAAASSANAAIAGVQERLRVDQVNDERAVSEFLCLMRESYEGLASVVLDKVHAAGLFWR